MRLANRFFLGFFVVVLLLAGSCVDEPLVEIPVTETATTSSLAEMSELISTFDIVVDLISTSDMFMKKGESLMPNEAVFEYIDSTFNDGTGIEILVDFGALGDTPQGLLCKDEKYRAGKMRLVLDKPYILPDAELIVSFDKENPFYTGNGQQMIEFTGKFYVTRVGLTDLKLHCANLNGKTGSEEFTINTVLDVKTTKEVGLGLVNDELSFQGEIKVTNAQTEVLLSTTEPFYKNYTLDCAKHIVTGIMKVNQSDNKSEITVDFDPEQNKACDNKVALTVNGKRIIYTY
jgi:hypothetical protein